MPSDIAAWQLIAESSIKTFLRARCLLLSSFAHKCLFPVWPCAFQKTEKYLQKVIYTESPITEHLLTGIIPMYPVGITKQVNHIMFA